MNLFWILILVKISTGDAAPLRASSIFDLMADSKASSIRSPDLKSDPANLSTLNQ
jgi:hypothetical protein